MWDAYAAAHPEAVAASPDYTVEHLGDSKRLANELLGVVLSGRKRATAEIIADFIGRGDQMPRIGTHWVAFEVVWPPEHADTRAATVKVPQQ
ncbi:hypothetical protein [Arthrobacter sp. ZGTC131]|uniref:hypothetical protein n=1 Tax=Arthrobacter sp. ZGTC131 TaxID=2058898 RepID=UPI0015E47FF2|nr:hypothetical protein [Arthrobacter sp. ZGTC131]